MCQQYGRKAMQFPFKTVDLIAACEGKAAHHIARAEHYQGIADRAVEEIKAKGITFNAEPSDQHLSFSRGGLEIDRELQNSAESAHYKAENHREKAREYQSYVLGLRETVTAYTEQFNQSEDMREQQEREMQGLRDGGPFGPPPGVPGITQFPQKESTFVRQEVDVNVLRTAVTADDLVWLGLVLLPGEWIIPSAE